MRRTGRNDDVFQLGRSLVDVLLRADEPIDDLERVRVEGDVCHVWCHAYTVDNKYPQNELWPL